MMNEIKSFIKKFSLLMWAAIIITAIAVFPVIVSAQVVGSTKTEEYRASFEKKINIDSLLDYSGPKVPIQLLNIGINEEVFAMYPELKDKRVGLGVTNIIVEYMEETNRFTFTEDKTEIKNRMVKQFQASQSGITENKLDGRGKIKLAQYFVYAEVYDFSVSEDETINLKDGVKNKVVTRLGLQIKFVNAETGEYFTGSGLGEAKTVRELTLMNDDNFGEIKFNQSTIGTTTKKALEDATAKILVRMIKKGIFKS
jgi:curli biogenesis system outer membrane secretion channel CsgG